MIDRHAIEQLPLEQITRVTFYKRDEITTDLICCDVELNGRSWFFHEDVTGWDLLLKHLEQLPLFKRDWHETLVQPPFDRREIVAFSRN
jgi:hypothetical protein